jgi:N-acetylneuraminic acid mutarotase
MSIFKWDLLNESSNNLSSHFSRSSHTINFIDNKIYIFGGEHVPRVPIDNNLIVFDLKENKQSVIEATNNSPSPRVGHASCTIDKKLYVFGGRGGIEFEDSFNDLFVFDTVSNNWQCLNTNGQNELPEKRSYHTMASSNNKLYVFGGCGKNGRLNDLYEYDVLKNSWAKLITDDRIIACGGASLVYRDDHLYLIGGFCGNELDTCFKYSIKNKTWSTIANLPRKLSVFASASIIENSSSNFKIILNGGEVDPSKLGHSGTGEFSQDTYAYDGEHWHLLKFTVNDTKPSNRGWHAGCIGDNYFYIYGGNLENNQRTNELWRLRIF